VVEGNYASGLPGASADRCRMTSGSRRGNGCRNPGLLVEFSDVEEIEIELER
jgi:hypothetical protein